MGLFPNQKITSKLFQVLDDDDSGYLDFEEIISFLGMMIKGQFIDKVRFIFDFIVY